MIKSPLFIFPVSKLFNDKEPDQEEQVLDCEIPFSAEDLGFQPTKPLTGLISLQKVGNDIDVCIENLSTKTSFVCERCLKSFSKSLKINQSHYLFEKICKKKRHELDDIYVIQEKDLTIDLNKPIFQELVMSIPLQLLCQKNCQGLCPKCGKNLNNSTCTCAVKNKPKEKNKPLKDLKRMFLLAKKRNID